MEQLDLLLKKKMRGVLCALCLKELEQGETVQYTTFLSDGSQRCTHYLITFVQDPICTICGASMPTMNGKCWACLTDEDFK